MADEISIPKKIRIRDKGFDEKWLQDKIIKNPDWLGLSNGNLESHSKELIQSGGGRLDILLRDPENEGCMYEVEVMLGETDESHIIRTIEYWDKNKRIYPLRKHYAVLVAETINRRFYNVIQLMSLNIPIIAIQVELLEIDNRLFLNFVKVLNSYEEPAVSELPTEIVTKESWQKESPWTLAFAERFAKAVNNSDLNFTQSYISLRIAGINMVVFNKRKQPNSLLRMRVIEESKVNQINKLLDDKDIQHSYDDSFVRIADINEIFLNKHVDVLRQAYDIIYQKNN